MTIKVGYYFPEVSSAFKYYNGTILEEEYEKKLMVSYTGCKEKKFWN